MIGKVPREGSSRNWASVLKGKEARLDNRPTARRV